MTKKEKELFDMMRNFKNLKPKEQGFIFGLSEGLILGRNDSILDCYEKYTDVTIQTS